MMRAQVRVTRIVRYKFDELSDDAKEKARDWFRTDYPYDDWWDGVYEDADQCGKLIGIEIKRSETQHSTLRNEKLSIYFSGFWSQGDGACFDGSYTYPEFDSVERSPTQLIRQHAPKDAELHRIADTLETLQAELAVLLPSARLIAKVKHSGHYYHSGCMEVDTGDTGAGLFDDDLDMLAAVARIDIGVIQAMRDFADWIYSQLEKEHEWLCADEQVDESITANEYTFDEDGNREG